MTRVSLAGGTVELPRIILGGHEYLEDGRSRAFNEDLARAVTPGVVFPGFGGPLRLSVLARALELGINAFDVTIDSEKEALGRNLADIGNLEGAVIQTRPEGMVYSYDPGNRKMIEPGMLRAEVVRALRLLRREQLDILNIGILSSALDQTPGFADRLGNVIRELKAEGLVRCAAADTFSGEAAYEAMLSTGVFDTINVNFNIADDGASFSLMRSARDRGVRVVVREVFIKGALFGLAAEAGVTDIAALARAAVKFVANQDAVDAIIIGARSPDELSASVTASASPVLDTGEAEALERVMALPRFLDLRAKNRAAFATPLISRTTS
ncbi:MAG: aldo/keto reductase [Comamonadaceae bacterium]|nr:MAG: aldo/keto reductase [Comamonadaceae bacterium]